MIYRVGNFYPNQDLDFGFVAILEPVSGYEKASLYEMLWGW